MHGFSFHDQHQDGAFSRRRFSASPPKNGSPTGSHAPADRRARGLLRQPGRRSIARATAASSAGSDVGGFTKRLAIPARSPSW